MVVMIAQGKLKNNYGTDLAIHGPISCCIPEATSNPSKFLNCMLEFAGGILFIYLYTVRTNITVMQNRTCLNGLVLPFKIKASQTAQP